MPEHEIASCDALYSFQIEGAVVRGQLVRLGPALDAMLRPHDYPAPVAALLAEAAVLAVMLSASIKYDGLFALQAQGNGAVSLLVVDVTSEGHVRGYARFDADALAAIAEPVVDGAPSVPHLLGGGHLAFTVDQGPDMERYQGITALDGETLSSCAHHYFKNSEQLDTLIMMSADVSAPENQMTAAGMMIQRLPETGGTHGAVSEEQKESHFESWRRAAILMGSLKREELLDPALTPENLLFRLYHEDGVRLVLQKMLAHVCRCSREKVQNTLKSFPRDEVTQDDGSAEVVCEFCRAPYHFSPDALDALYE